MSSEKWKTSYDVNRQYKKIWEQKFLWLQMVEDGTHSAYCKWCHCIMKPKMTNLVKHNKSLKHKQSTPLIESFTDINLAEDIKKAELRIALTMTCHYAVRTVDHLNEVFVVYGRGSLLEHVKIHRTKCMGLIKNVISPSLRDDVVEDFKNKKYALIIDESTDISADKHLCILARFFSVLKNEIVTKFMGLILVHETTGENIFHLLDQETKKCGQSLTNCIGFATDGASNMTGCNNSVWTKIKEVSPNCVQLKCICHSLALCIEHAVSKLPSNIAFLLSEIPHWFCNSSLRREDYIDLFNVINAATESETARYAPLPFEKSSFTRWLALGKEFERMNSLFQQTKADPCELYKQMNLFQVSLNHRIYDFNSNKKSIYKVDFGAKFIKECDSYLQNCNHSIDSIKKIKNLKERCLCVLDEAYTQVTSRLPSSMETFKNLSTMNPDIILSKESRPDISELPFLHLLKDDLGLIEEQYRKILFVDWKEEEPFKTGGFPTDTEQFWLGVLQHNTFKNLANYALTCLITPVSNAVVERIFSLVSATKTKARNRISLNMLDAVVRIRSELILSEKCCQDFTISKKMLTNFSSDIVYKSDIGDSSFSENIDDFEVDI
nr:SCAN domain-containing protein 3-like [Hydra vulgaris]